MDRIESKALVTQVLEFVKTMTTIASPEDRFYMAKELAAWFKPELDEIARDSHAHD